MEHLSHAIPLAENKTRFKKAVRRVVQTLVDDEGRAKDHEQKDKTGSLEGKITDLATLLRPWRKHKRKQE